MNRIQKGKTVGYKTHSTLLDKFISKKRLADSTAHIYKYAIKSYESFNNMVIEDLMEEADMEEDNRVKLKRRRLKNRLEDYLLYNLNTSDLLNSSAMRYFNLILSFYRYWGIEIPRLDKPIVKKDYHLSYNDIPNQNHIRQALKGCKNVKQEAIILFMSSSGTAKNELLSLKVKDFFNATTEYHSNSGDITRCCMSYKIQKLNMEKVLFLFFNLLD